MGEKPRVDILEYGTDRDGTRTSTDKRLFMQLQAFGSCTNEQELVNGLEKAKIQGVLYRDINDPQGVGLLTDVGRPDLLRNDRLRELLSGRSLS